MESSPEKKEDVRTVVGRGKRSLLSDPGSELRLGRRRKKSAKKIEGMKKKKYRQFSQYFDH